jgi:hypothetical protein
MEVAFADFHNQISLPCEVYSTFHFPPFHCPLNKDSYLSQVRTLAYALRGSIQDRPSTPGFGDFHQIDQQNLLPALLMAYQKMYQGHVATAHMPEAEGEDQT